MKSAAGWGRQQWRDRRALAGDSNEERRMGYLTGKGDAIGSILGRSRWEEVKK
jgi:hypothetical protein